MKMDARTRLNRENYSNFFFDLFFYNTIPGIYQPELKNKANEKIYYPELARVTQQGNKGVKVIIDVPSYFELKESADATSLKKLQIRQYDGFLVDLQGYGSVSDFLTVQLSKRNRKNLRSKKSKLEREHDIRYEFYHGTIDKDHYTYLFQCFYNLLKQRFLEKKVYNKNLVQWDYYYHLVYTAILEKRASLFVIYDKTKPITISLSFHQDNHSFSYIQTYDIDYSQFGMGDISMLRQLEWSYENGYLLFDLSKGENEYKIKWCNYRYNYFYHVYYPFDAYLPKIKASIIRQKLYLKQYLRDIGVLGNLFQFEKFFFKRLMKKVDAFETSDRYPFK